MTSLHTYILNKSDGFAWFPLYFRETVLDTIQIRGHKGIAVHNLTNHTFPKLVLSGDETLLFHTRRAIDAEIRPYPFSFVIVAPLALLDKESAPKFDVVWRHLRHLQQGRDYQVNQYSPDDEEVPADYQREELFNLGFSRYSHMQRVASSLPYARINNESAMEQKAPEMANQTRLLAASANRSVLTVNFSVAKRPKAVAGTNSGNVVNLFGQPR